MTCILCNGTWQVSAHDNLCEDCGVRVADEARARQLATEAAFARR